MAGANLAPSLVDPYRTESEDEEGEDSGSKRECSPDTTPVKGKDARNDDARAGAEQSRVEEGGVAGEVREGGSSTATEGGGALETGMGGATEKVRCEFCGGSFISLSIHRGATKKLSCKGGDSVRRNPRRSLETMMGKGMVAGAKGEAMGNRASQRSAAKGAEGPLFGCGAGGAATATPPPAGGGSGGDRAAEDRLDRYRRVEASRNVQRNLDGKWVKRNPHICETCGKAFRDSKSRASHMRTHSGLGGSKPGIE